MDDFLQTIWELSQPAWEWAKQYQDLSIFFLTGGIAFLGWLSQGLWKQLRRGANKKRLVPDFEPFQVIPPHTATVLQKLMPSPQPEADPLADFNIPYQQRQEGISVRRDLEDHLNEFGCLLIVGRTGLGKTREAAELAKVLNNEGWTILKLVQPEVLGTNLPKEYLGNKHKLLLFLDDLNQAMYRGRMREPEDNEYKLPPVLKMPLQERLQRVLEFLEAECRPSEIRVIATARNEPETERPDQPSEWDKLEVERYRTFWNRFKQYQLREPDDAAFYNTLVETVTHAQIQAKADDFSQITVQSDHTFRNIVENLVRIRNRNLQLSIDTFLPTLRGTWEARYQAVRKQFPSACYLYDAIDLLQQLNAPLVDPLVVSTARMLIKEARWRTCWYQWQLPRTLNKLKQLERIHQPRDGQIEAKGYLLNLADYVLELMPIFKAQAKQSDDLFLLAWIKLGTTLDGFGHYSEAILAYDAVLDIEPNFDVVFFLKGFVLQRLDRNEEAIAAYDLALGINPNNDLVLCLKGIALEDIKRYEEAIEAYNLAQATESKIHVEKSQPRFYLRWSQYWELSSEARFRALYSKGILLFMTARYEEAIDTCNTVLAISPNNFYALSTKGHALTCLGRYEEAIVAYDEALDIDQENPHLLCMKGCCFMSLGRYVEAVAVFDKALVTKPDFPEVIYLKDIALGKLGAAFSNPQRYEEAIVHLNKAVYIHPNGSGFYLHLALCYAITDDTDQALNNLEILFKLDPEKARKAVIASQVFEYLHENPRFQALMALSKNGSE